MAKKIIDRSNVVRYCFLCVVSLWQANAGLLDPISIGNELQKFARDALGIDQMQVLNSAFSFFCFFFKKYDHEITEVRRYKLVLHLC